VIAEKNLQSGANTSKDITIKTRGAWQGRNQLLNEKNSSYLITFLSSFSNSL